MKREKDYKLHGVHIGAHGDKGNNGSRGSIQQLELSYGNAVIGHSHSPGILRNIWQVGTSTKLILDYNIYSLILIFFHFLTEYQFSFLQFFHF